MFRRLKSHFRLFHSYEGVTITNEGSQFDPYSALIIIEQLGFLSVPHLLWHGASSYNGHLRDRCDSPPVVERLAVVLPDDFYDLGLSRMGTEHYTEKIHITKSYIIKFLVNIWSHGKNLQDLNVPIPCRNGGLVYHLVNCHGFHRLKILFFLISKIIS